MGIPVLTKTRPDWMTRLAIDSAVLMGMRHGRGTVLIAPKEARNVYQCFPNFLRKLSLKRTVGVTLARNYLVLVFFLMLTM